MHADVAVAIFLLGIPNAYQLGKRLRFSPETAYRQFHSLQEPIVAEQIHFLAKEAGKIA